RRRATTVRANAPGGAQTAAPLQNGPATHARSVLTAPDTLTFVPEFAHADDFLRTGDAFPTLTRPIRVPNAGILDAVLDWFGDVAANGAPGTFRLNVVPNFNPVENLEAPAGASTLRFFARTVDAGGALALSEPTPDVTVDFETNLVASRVTAARTMLGSAPNVADVDVPPGPFSTVGTPGILPFFVTLQRAVPGTFSAGVTIAYTEAERDLAGLPAESSPDLTAESALVVAEFTPGTCAADGGPTCDGDRTADGICTFRVARCVGMTSPRCKGKAGRTRAFAVRARFGGASGALEKANIEALVASAVALGGRAVGGRGPVRFEPALAGGVCAPFADIKVPVDRSRMELLRAA